MPLSVRLRSGTQQSHTAAENTAYMKCALKGIVEREPYRKWLANLYMVYSALEAALDQHRDHPLVGSIVFTELYRRVSLVQDLVFYYGEDWANHIVPLVAGQAYRARIQEIAQHNPVLLIAHAYTRYMGDLSGGQVLKQIVCIALDLPPNQGTSLYEFEQLPTPEARRVCKKKTIAKPLIP